MKLGRLNHVGVAVPSLDKAIAFYRDVLGASAITDPMVMARQQVRLCFVRAPGEGGTFGTEIELLEPAGPDSPIARWLERNPLGGQHHLCFEVTDIGMARRWFEGLGKRVLGETAIGAHGTPVFFVHPRDMGGVLTEIMEAPKSGH